MQPNWLLLGHFGGANIGDEAMLAGALTYTRRHGMPCRVVVSDIGAASRIHGSDQTEWLPDSTFGTLIQILRVRGVAFCGGTHLHDELAGTRLIYHWASLLKYCCYLWFARLTGRNVAMIGHGVGRLEKRITRLLAATMLRACHSVTVRDRASADALRQFRVAGKITTGFDLAALVESEGEVASPYPKAVKSQIVIAPRNAGGFDLSYWVTVVAEAVDAVGLEDVILMPFQLSWPANDEVFVEQIRDSVFRRLGREVNVCSVNGDPKSCLDVLGGARLTVAGRYHAAVLAILANSPVLIVPYESKLLALALDIGIDSERIAVLNEKGGRLRRLLDSDGAPISTGDLRSRASICAGSLMMR